MRTISIINLKGGVAKTTSSINIAYILTQRGYKVLLVDNDKQGDCSRGLNRRTSDGDGIDRIMTDRHPDMQSLIHNTDYENLDIITANLGLLSANMEVVMDRVRPQQNRLRKALQQVSDQYDFCVVDNAPDINISVINALTAANDVLIPVEVDDNTLEGIRYMDDFWMLLPTKEQAEKTYTETVEKIQAYGLEINEKKSHVVPLRKGFTFLGFRYRMTDTGKVIMTLNPDSVKHERKTLARMVNKSKRGELPLEKVEEHHNAWQNNAEKGNSNKVRERTRKYLKQLKGDEKNESKKNVSDTSRGGRERKSQSNRRKAEPDHRESEGNDPVSGSNDRCLYSGRGGRGRCTEFC